MKLDKGQADCCAEHIVKGWEGTIAMKTTVEPILLRSEAGWLPMASWVEHIIKGGE